MRYLRDRFFAARSIYSIESGNEQLTKFIEQIAHTRMHPVQRERSVADCLAEERVRLLSLPPAPAATEQLITVQVDKTATIRFETNYYSVPPAYTQRSLTLAADDTTVRLLDGTELVAQHARCWGRRQQIDNQAHRDEILARKRAGRDLKGRDRLRAVVPEIDVLLIRWLEAGRNVGNSVMRTIKLLDLYGDTVLAEATAEMISRGTSDFGALCVLCEQRRRAHERPVPIDIVFGNHVPDRDVTPHDLESYDAINRRR